VGELHRLKIVGGPAVPLRSTSLWPLHYDSCTNCLRK